MILHYFKFFLFTALGEGSQKKPLRSLTREDERRWKQLLESASTGNSSDYEILLNEIYSYLKIFCSRYLKSDSQVEDCIQNTLMAIHRSKHTYQTNRPFGPWFFTIVRRKICDQYRLIKKDSKQLVFDADYEIHPATKSDNLDMAKEIEVLLGRLQPKFREIIELTKLSGLSTREVASKLNISESAVKVRSYRASKVLRSLIEKEFDKRN